MKEFVDAPLSVPTNSNADLRNRFARQGWYALTAEQLSTLLHLETSRCAPLVAIWDDLPLDAYLRDGGRYRRRRHSSFIQTLGPKPVAEGLLPVPHRAHWQPTTYNALHGGIERWFAPLSVPLTQAAAWKPLLLGLGEFFASIRPAAQWFIEAHQFRITTDGGVGRPTPEGAHRDGVDFIAIIVLQRQKIHGGETRVFTQTGTELSRLTLSEPCSVLLLDDTQVIHETSPIEPSINNELGWRDTLVLTYRAEGFLDPEDR
ncbi:2OG-Fe dioxygenase family protein [Acidithiobacillus sp. AMEEHan]|uniref:2OG-Fe dioxygenase family protein n=1 Tax=Acidithiobacillus sp. AMEEHan TaxID=2994951 RepID=UPI0027E3CA96|nr:2OG-Fe dioxygenase family protein [Acidithiobacillus sp. AMEEHan]